MASSLNPLEKLLLTLSSFVLSHRLFRQGFVLYLVAVHIFLFLNLFELLSTSEQLRSQSEQTAVPPID